MGEFFKPSNEEGDNQNEVAERIEAEEQRLRQNLAELESSVKQFENEEELKEALISNESLAWTIAEKLSSAMFWVAFLGPDFLGGDVYESIHSGDPKLIAASVFKLALGGAAVAISWEGVKSGARYVKEKGDMVAEYMDKTFKGLAEKNQE